MHRSSACLLLAACLMSPARAADPADEKEVRTEPLSRVRAAEILARSDEIADGIVKQIVSGRKSRTSVLLEDVQDVMNPAPEWRWYSRDHGILLAIPVRERLGISTKVEGERALADIARRLLHQKGWANPPVQVVFIEPETAYPLPGSCVTCAVSPASHAASGCDCR